MVFRGTASNIDIGYVLPLGHIPEGTLVCNVEATPGDGGKIAKSSGAYAIVVSHTSIGSELRFPSGKTKYLDDRCRATIGVIAGSGRIEKPFVKAGVKRALMLSKGRVWPVVKGQAMIAASHPYGGGRHKHAGKPTTVGRHTPPGRKVGLIAARQSGRAKRRAR
jgi:large subunit ribosomal protein L2